ncbi:MAG: hypothetical protein Kow00107_08210 [Planctomycetota bacterium]
MRFKQKGCPPFETGKAPTEFPKLLFAFGPAILREPLNSPGIVKAGTKNVFKFGISNYNVGMRRKYYATPSQEDYLEAILNLSEEGRVRISDIASAVGVGKSSTSLAVKALCEKELVSHHSYGAVELTPAGKRLAEQVRRNHRIILDFLLDQLQLPREIAERDACAMEHVVSPELVNRFVRFLEFTSTCPLGRAKWSEAKGRFHHEDEKGGDHGQCK